MVNKHLLTNTELGLGLSVKYSLADIEQSAWDHCLGEGGSPFLTHTFLYGLELCHCVGGETGWFPRYLIVEKENQIVGVTAAYVKTHSQGEFIFDWSWADAAHRVGFPYYPKLVVTSPFSPVGSQKLLVAKEQNDTLGEEIQSLLIKGLRQLTLDEDLTGLHLLFTCPKEMPLMNRSGLLPRHTLQFHWHNQGYQCFDDFLSCFKSKKRNQIRRERKKVKQAGVEVKAFWGSAVQEEHIPLIYQFYKTTVEKYFFGNLYLTYEFFQHLYRFQRETLCLLLAYQGNRIIGGSFNLLHNQVLYGRYWGIEEQSEVDYLHFEVCAYKGIETCIEQGWKRFEAGSGGGAHKYGRGFLPAIIYSAHEVYLPGFKPAITEALASERAAIEQELEQIQGEILKPWSSTPTKEET